MVEKVDIVFVFCAHINALGKGFAQTNYVEITDAYKLEQVHLSVLDDRKKVEIVYISTAEKEIFVRMFLKYPNRPNKSTILDHE